MFGLFTWSGRLTVILMLTAGATGLFGPFFRRFMKGPRVLKIHKWCGLGAILSGLVHGLIYVLFMQ